MGGNLSTLGENIIETSADRPESSHHCIFNPRENGSEVRFAIFILLYRKEGYAGYGKWGGEDVLRMWITPPDICSGVSQITYIYIRHKRPALLWREYILAGVGGSVWAPSALLINTITSCTKYNSKKCANTFIDDGAQLILICFASIMPGPWAFTRILTYSHIFPCGAHLIGIFTYTETPTSPLSYYTHPILLCCPSLVSARLCVALLIPAPTDLRLSSSHHVTATTSPRHHESLRFQLLATM